MDTLLICIFLPSLLISFIWACVAYDTLYKPKLGRIFVIGAIISLVMFLYAFISWTNKGDNIEAELRKNPDIIVLDDNGLSGDLFRLLPPLKYKTYVIEDGKDINYYEIIK